MRESNYWHRIIKEIEPDNLDINESIWLINESHELKRY
jgi:hypothetical protein